MKNFFLPLFLSCLVVFSSCSSDDDSTTDPTIINKQLTGSSANDLLSSTNYNSLNIEIIYVDGYEPTSAAINSLRQFLEARTYKPNGISITTSSIPSPGDPSLSIDEVVELENTYRTQYSEGDEIAVYMLYVDGSRETDTENQVTLGSAYWNTSIVIYGNTIHNLSNQPNAPSKSVIEAITFRHEFGHLLGLVNIGTDLQTPHEHETYEGHCENDGCLMEASVAFGSGLLNLLGNSTGIPNLGPECIADLQANGGR